MNRPSKRTEAGFPKTTVLVACLSTGMLMLDISVVNTALTDISQGLNTGLGGLQWVVSAYTIPLAATVLTAGALADRFGRRKVFMSGLAAFTVASILCGIAGGIEVLVGARALQGLGGSLMFGTALALISQATPEPRARAKALGAYGAVISAAFALGPFVGGALTEVFGWRAIFVINVPIGAAALWMTYRRVAESRESAPRPVDVPGQVTLIAGLFLLVLGLLRGNEEGWGDPAIVAALISAVVLLIAFAVIESRSRNPMLPLGLLRQRRFAGPQVAVFAISASYFAVFFYLTLYLQTVLGLSPIQTGLAYLPGLVVAAAVATLTGRVAHRSSPAKIASVGLMLVGAGLAGMLTLDVDSSWTVILPGFLLVSIGTGLYNPTGSALALSALGREQSGLAGGTNNAFRQAGVGVGIAALGTLVPAGAALGGDPQAYVDGLHNALIAASAIAICGAIATAWMLIPVGRPQGDERPAAAPASPR